ncbi:FAD-dependent monooxygenase [Nonomuraea sp. NPDC050556]|uniref:FAD-dependent monooxygenase n=1 Tax=Nonomuraea sp. NPDC050556 TaxID=3364369 RepID=UPI0037B791DD
MARAVVIGGGIGGLTAGVALHQRGWDVTVMERAEKIEPVGSGLAIAANALKALDVIGLGDEVRKLSSIQGMAGIQSADGRWITHTTEDTAHERYGDSIVMMLRATLTELLLDALPNGALRLGAEVREIPDADLVVAADGIHSATRKKLFPEHPGPVYSGTTAWRVLVPKPDRPLQTTETWGRGMVVGVMPLAGDLVYMYATDVLPAGTVFPKRQDERTEQDERAEQHERAEQEERAEQDERAELLRRFGGWHDPIPALLESADNARIIRNDVYYLDTPLPAMHQGNIALLGDAAHPMTPNLGQGACQAIEDAVVLSLLADRGLAAYTAARLDRTAKVVKMSRQICALTKVRNPLAVRLRDAGMRLGSRLNPDLMLKSMDEVLAWHPPVPSSGQAPAVQG